MLLALVLAPAIVAGGEPFWKREKFRDRLDQGEVLVSVTTQSGPAGRELRLAGGGRVKAPLGFTYAYARRLDQVAKTSHFVERARVNGDELTVTFAALGRRAEFAMDVSHDDERHDLGLTVKGGPLAGLKATLHFAEASPGVTEVGVEGLYREPGRVRGAILGLGLEGVFKALAERLKAGAEAAFRVDKARVDVKGSAA